MAVFSERYEAALALAANVHGDQVRKVGGDPYIVHVAHVSVILLRAGFAEDVALAGLLHDAVEDQNVPLAEIEADFGPVVAEMVAAVTERKYEGGVARRWEDRKREALEHLRGASRGTAALKAADTLHNIHSLLLGLRRDGDSVWKRFSRGPEETLWYYDSVADIVRQRLDDHPLSRELDAALARLKRAIGEHGIGTADPPGMETEG
jgi:(p)ppGpp synthase/HD superfamily hydrolase